MANIINALAYFGQQKIQAGVIGTNNQFTTTGTITSQTDMDNIKYQVAANPTAADGT